MCTWKGGEPEYPMMLPPSLPSSPNETDLDANCFERASMQPTMTTYDDLSPSPNPDAQIEMVLLDDRFNPGGTRTKGSFCQVEVVLWGWWWWEKGEQELQRTSDPDVEQEPQSFFIRDEESCCDNEEPPWILWAWTSFESRVGRYGYWVWPP